MICDTTPGRRRVFRQCLLIKVTDYISDFRGGTTRVFRQTFRTPDYAGQLVYTGRNLNVAPDKAVDIKATVKREEKLAVNFLRISRPILLDKPAPVPLLD